MSELSILVRLDRLTDLDPTLAKRRLAEIGSLGQLVEKINVVEGEEDGGYINVTYTSSDLKTLWLRVRSELDGTPSLLGCTIVVCTGEFGWDDYLLLHHFSESEPLDELK